MQQPVQISARKSVAVTPSDTTAVAFDALYIGVSGDVAITDTAGNVVTFKSAAVGFFPIACYKVMAANTTATNIVGLNL